MLYCALCVCVCVCVCVCSSLVDTQLQLGCALQSTIQHTTTLCCCWCILMLCVCFSGPAKLPHSVHHCQHWNRTFIQSAHTISPTTLSLSLSLSHTHTHTHTPNPKVAFPCIRGIIPHLRFATSHCFRRRRGGRAYLVCLPIFFGGERRRRGGLMDVFRPPRLPPPRVSRHMPPHQ